MTGANVENSKLPDENSSKTSSIEPSLSSVGLNERIISRSVSEFSVVVVALATVVVVVAVVSAVVVLATFGVIYGFFSLSNIFSLSLLPKSLFQGIRPRITLDAVVELIDIVETDVSVCPLKNGLIVGLIMGAIAYVIYSLETSGRNSVCAEMGVSVLCENGVEEVAGFSTCPSLFFLSSSQSEKQNKTKQAKHKIQIRNTIRNTKIKMD